MFEFISLLSPGGQSTKWLTKAEYLNLLSIISKTKKISGITLNSLQANSVRAFVEFLGPPIKSELNY